MTASIGIWAPGEPTGDVVVVAILRAYKRAGSAPATAHAYYYGPMISDRPPPDATNTVGEQGSESMRRRGGQRGGVGGGRDAASLFLTLRARSMAAQAGNSPDQRG